MMSLLYHHKEMLNAFLAAQPYLNADGALFEIGCYRGGSLYEWCHNTLRKGRKSPIIAVDPYFTRTQDSEGTEDPEKFFREVTTMFQSYPNGSFFRLTSHDFFAKVAPWLTVSTISGPQKLKDVGFSFALVDGSHKMEEEIEDVIETAKYMRSDAFLLVVDDTHIKSKEAGKEDSYPVEDVIRSLFPSDYIKLLTSEIDIRQMVVARGIPEDVLEKCFTGSTGNPVWMGK